MEIQLKNIGMIKEANVKLDGLTVIAGENDTGKSTVGKAFYLMLKSPQLAKDFRTDDQYKKDVFPISLFQHLKLLFKYDKLNDDAFISLNNNGKKYFFSNSCVQGIMHKKDKDIIFIETPLVWNFTDFFRDIALIESQMKIEVDYPFLMKDLNFKLFIKNAFDGINIKDNMTNLMGGEFKKDEMGRYYFNKQGKRIELVNTATGIKTFGLFQVLSQNNWLNKNTVLILDEPEVHLHPKWQLKMAEVIVNLVKNGVKVLVNSHSPYMIEAIQRYSEREQVTADFYLAEDGYITEQENLENIFEKLALPMRELKKLKINRYLND